MLVGHMCNDFSQGALPALLPFLVSIKGIDYASAAGLVFATAFFSSLIQPLLGLISDKRSMPWLMPAGMFMSGLGISMTGYLDSYWHIFAAVVFAGVGTALFHPEGARMANYVAGKKQKGRGLGLFNAGGNMGFVLGPVIIAIAVSNLGLRGTGVIMIPVVITTLLFISQLKNLEKFSGILTPEEKAEKISHGEVDRWKDFGILCIPAFARSIGVAAMNTFVPLYWVSIMMQSSGKGSLMVTVMALASLVSNLISGPLSDRFGSPKVIRASFFVIGPLIILFLFTKNIWIATILVALIGLSLNFPYSPMVVLGQKYLPHHLGVASGITVGVSVSIGGIVSPFLGKIGDLHGLTTVISVVAAICILGAISTVFVKEG